MANENYSNFTSTRPNKDFYRPNQPENHRKEREREEGKGSESERKKRLAQSLVFIAYLGLFLPYCNIKIQCSL